MLTMSNVTRTGEALRFVINADLMVSVPTGRVPKLSFVGAILSWDGQPDTDSPPAKLISHYSDSGHRDKIVLGWFLILIGVFFFLWFLGALRQALRRLDGDGLLSTVATVGGATYATCTLIAYSVNAGICNSGFTMITPKASSAMVPILVNELR